MTMFLYITKILCYYYWWSEELIRLKDKVVESNKTWKEVGRPRTGPIDDLRNGDKRVCITYFTNLMVASKYAQKSTEKEKQEKTRT